MSDEQSTPVEGEVKPQGTPVAETVTAVEEPPVTPDEIESARSRGDSAALEKIEERITKRGRPKKETKPEGEVAPKADASPEPQAKPDETGGDRKFKVPFKGREIVEDDSDTYLGYKNHGALKRNTILFRERLREAQEEAESLRRQYDSRVREGESTKAELEKLRKEYADSLAKLKSASAPVPPQPAQAPAASPAELKPPEKPTFSSTNRQLWEDEDWAKLEKYEEDREKYLIESVTRRNTANPDFDALKKELAEMKEASKRLVEEREAERARMAAEEQRRQQESAANKIWDDFSEFQSSYEDFKTPKKLRELDADVKAWMNDVARANGVVMPLGGTVQDLSNFEAARGNLIARYINGDSAVLKSAEGIDPPEGYKTYFQLADVWKRKSELVNAGRLGGGASLEDAYLIMLKETGKLDKGAESIERDAMQRGQQSTLDAIGKTNSQYAKNLPNQSTAREASDNLSKEDIQSILTTAKTPEGRASLDNTPDTNLKAKWERIKRTYNI
ncbi:MAG: hypothetical protein ABIH23_04320 [bacterium]